MNDELHETFKKLKNKAMDSYKCSSATTQWYKHVQELWNVL